MEQSENMKEILEYLNIAYILCDQTKVLSKNKCVNELLENSIENSHFTFEEDVEQLSDALILLEDIYKKANSREFINNKLNPEIIEFLTKDNDNIKSKQDTTQEMKENIKTVENTICELIKGLNSSKSKSNLLHSLSFQLDDPEEETKVVGNKKKTTSLFRNQLISNFKKKKDLSKVHFVFSKFKQDFASFIQIFTIPFRERTETKIYQISLRIKKQPLDDKNNIFEYLIKDVTKEKEAEALKNEIRCKSLFLAKIAHEFKNPIITINSVCQTLNSRISQLLNMNNSYQSSDYDSEEEAKLNSIMTKRKSSIVNHNSLQENINFIITTGNYLMSLIYDLNYFTRVELNPHRRYSSNDILDENNLSKDCEFDLIPSLEFCLKIFRERQKNDDNKKNVTILSEYDKRLPDRINSNEMKLKQILVNLLSNAYKFTIVGKITLSAKMIDRNHIRLEISDTGTGIPEDRIEKIWDPFSLNEKNQSMNTYGSGLGLYIVKDLCRQINSNICYCSSEGEGSKFWFDVRTSQGESVNNNLSTKTLLQKPLMSESLKNIYQCNYSNNYPYSSDRTDKEIRCKSFEGNFNNKNSISNQKFESCLNLIKIKELLDLSANHNGFEPQKRLTVKNFYHNNLSNKNLVNSESDIAESFCQDSSDFSSPPSFRMRINNLSRKHILETKFSPFNTEIRQVKNSPVPGFISKGMSNNNRLKEIVEGVEDNDGKNPVRIMVCDDDSSMRESIVRLIQKVADEKKVAVEVKESINGLECLNQIYQAFVSGCNFEAVLLDEAMPFMKGSKCMNILRDMNKEGFMNKIRKISISSFEDLETIKYIKAQGCDEFLPKPHNKEAISKFIESLVN